MKKAIVLFMLVLFISGITYSQSAKSVYFELGGPGLASFNFDTRFTGKNDGIGGRIGVGGFSIDDVGAIYVPIGLNYLIGKDTKHFFEVGAGVTYVDFNDNDDYSDGIFETTFGYLSFGYRMQPIRNGFTFRASIVPIFNRHGFLPYYGGVSFGYKF